MTDSSMKSDYLVQDQNPCDNQNIAFKSPLFGIINKMSCHLEKLDQKQ